MKQTFLRRTLAVVTSLGVAAGLAIAGSASASAYQTSPGDLYTAQNAAACNKRPCVLYPKSAQLPTGRIVATFEDSESPVVGQTMPVFKSDDYGSTWQKLSEVQAPAYLSDDPQYAKYTSNWTNPYLYVLPEQVGDLAAGTLLLANIVSGDDAYYNEQKAANPNWTPTGDGDRQDLALALFSSTDDGATWNVVNVIATGGWQGGSAGAVGRTAAANTHQQVDPIWEPYLMAYDGELVAYYSDENDYLGYDPTTGIPILDPDNDTAPDSHGQILVHKTWDGTSAAWSDPVVDIPGLTENRGNGKYQIGGGRPGMETVVPTTDGKWLVTYEYWGGGDNVRYKIADDPLQFRTVSDADGENITALPTSGIKLSRGGSPVLTRFPDGRIVYNASGSGNVWVNESGRSDGTWKAYQTPIAGGYSRNLQIVDGTGRLLILQAAWAGNSVGPVKYSEVDLGHSEGAYYSIVNKLTGQVVSTEQDKTQDANLTGDKPDIITWANNPTNDTQRWHVTAKGTSVSFLNKAGGRSIGIWTGAATAGQRVVQWVDDGGSDKLWNLVPTSDGYYRIQSAKNTAVYMTAATAGGGVDLRANIDAAANPAADDAQEWALVQEPPTAAALTDKHRSTTLIGVDEAEPGAELVLDAAVTEPAPVASHANIPGHVYGFVGDGAAVDLGAVTFDADEKATITLPAGFEAGSTVKIAVQFDATPTVWDSFSVVAPDPVAVTAALSSAAPAGAAGWFTGPAEVTLTDNSDTATVEYRFGDAGEWLPATTAITVSTQGVTTVNYRATRSGEPIAGTAGSVDVKIDGDAPATSVAVDPASGTVAVGQTITAHFTATDATSGVAATEYSTDGGATWAPAPEEGVSFTEKGAHVVQYRSADVAGNVETAKDITLTVTEPEAPAWSAAQVYNTGAKVSYGGSTWVAQWWTQNQKPGDPYGPWAEVGALVDGEHRAWTASWVYTGGETVAYAGALWKAKWWTRNQIPGTPSGPWTQVGTL